MTASTLVDSSVSGFGSSEVWESLGQELKGTKTLEKPRVSKKVLVRALRLQTGVMQTMGLEFDKLSAKIAYVEKETKNTSKKLHSMEDKVHRLERALDDASLRADELQGQIKANQEKLKDMDDLKEENKKQAEFISALQENFQTQQVVHENFVAEVENNIEVLQGESKVLFQQTQNLEQRMDDDEKELIVPAEQVLCGNITLTRTLEILEQNAKVREQLVKDCEDRMAGQSALLQEMMLESRKSLDDNTNAVEEVQRVLIEKADRGKVDEIIESKYEEIIEHLQSALSSVNDDEDEYKRVCQELQELVQHLSSCKADKKDILEIKEQVLYDSRVRQQVENLRTFIDLKMNREEVFSAIKNKADKEDLEVMLRSLSDSMNASIKKASRIQNPEDAFLTKNSVNFKRKGSLPSLGKEKCLACSSTIQHPDNKGDDMISPTYGGGFQKKLPQSERHYPGQGLSSPVTDGPETNNFLLGVDGHVYQGDGIESRVGEVVLNPLQVPNPKKHMKLKPTNPSTVEKINSHTM